MQLKVDIDRSEMSTLHNHAYKYFIIIIIIKWYK